MSFRGLLIGGAGQVGREIAEQAQQNHLSLAVTTRATLDITDPDALARAYDVAEPEIVINASAYTAVDKAEGEPQQAFAANRDGPAHLAALCARHHIPLIHISTDYVYDGSKDQPYIETDPVAPLGVYGASKLAGEDAIRAVLESHVILRTAWVFGVHGSNFVKTMLRLSRERDGLKVVADQHGNPTFAADLAEAVIALAHRQLRPQNDDAGWGVFHCAGSGESTWHQFADAALERASPDLARTVPVIPIATSDFPTPAKRPRNSRLDCSRLARVHGIRMRPWTEALEAMLSRMRDQI